MNEENTQPNSGQPSQPVNPPASSASINPIDQGALNLTRAIAMQENGGQPNYDAVGDNGTSSGAYQWNNNGKPLQQGQVPQNFQSEASEYDLDPDDFSPENQDKTAYMRVLDLKNQGMNPDQIAASWNAGIQKAEDGSWKQNIGTTNINGQPVSFDTPAYVQGVNKYYNQIAQTNPSTPTTPSPATTSGGMPTWEKVLLGTGLAVGGGALAYFTGGADLPEVAAGEGALFGGEAAADAGAVEGGATAAEGGAADTAATAEGTAAETAAKPGLISKALNFGKTALIGEGVQRVAGLFGGGSSSTSGSSTAPNPSTGASVLPQSELAPSISATKNLVSAQNEALQQTAGGRVLSQSPDIQEGMMGNALYGLAPDVVDGNYDSSDALEKSEQTIAELSGNMSSSLDAEGSRGNISDAVAEAKSNLRKYNSNFTPSQIDEGDKQIEKEAGSYGRYADSQGTMTLGNFQRMKQQQGKAARSWDTQSTTAKQAAHKALSKGSRKVIENTTKNRELYKQVNKEERRLINGQKVLKRLNGKKAHKGKNMTRDVAHHLSEWVATAIGAKVGGPLGAILGNIVGDHLANRIDKRYGKSLMESPGVQRALEEVRKKKPAVADMIKAEIAKHIDKKKAEGLLDVKRQEYKAKKKGLLEPPSKASEYEPYSKDMPVIPMGKKSVPKNRKPVKGMKTIRA